MILACQSWQEIMTNTSDRKLQEGLPRYLRYCKIDQILSHKHLDTDRCPF